MQIKGEMHVFLISGVPKTHCRPLVNTIEAGCFLDEILSQIRCGFSLCFYMRLNQLAHTVILIYILVFLIMFCNLALVANLYCIKAFICSIYISVFMPCL